MDVARNNSVELSVSRWPKIVAQGSNKMVFQSKYNLLSSL